ncbi:MAG: trigger factor [bacterium]
MKVKMESPSACRRMLQVEVDSGEVDAEYEKIVQEYTREITVPGFRKGRAPSQLVRQRFAKDISEETCSRLIPLKYREALKSQDLSPVTVIEVRDVVMKRGEPLTFSITVDVPPQFTLPSYKGIPLEGRKVETTEEQIDKTIEGLRARAATFETVSDTPIEAGHLVQVDYVGKCNGVPVIEITPKTAQFGTGKGAWILAGEDGLIPGLGAAIVGASVGDTRAVPVSFPADFRVEALAGKQAEYTVVVKAMRKRLLPQLDEAFLKQLGVESVEKLREEIRTGMQRQMADVEKARLRNELAKELLSRTTIEVPESLVEDESKRLVQEIVSDSTNRGMTREEIIGKRDEILSAAGTSSKDNIKLDYILDAIATEEKVTVDEEEVDRAVAGIAARYRTEHEKVRHDLEAKGQLERVRRGIRVDKTLDLVLSQAKVTVS